jgi:dTDP-4-dehydrorhamnose reductase
VKVAVIGANGQLGADIVEYFSQKCEVVPLTHQDIEITDIDQSRRVFEELKPDVVINTAAYHNVPKCQEEPLRSFQINAQGALNLAKLSTERHFKLAHYSTDYVFDGQKKSPYWESDCPNPLNIYALTKLDGEKLIQNYSEKYFIIRVAGIYGKTPCRAKGGNFIDTMVKLDADRPLIHVVDDEILTPTSTMEIARNTYDLLLTEAYDLYHMTAQEAVSWYRFAKVIFEELNLKTPLKPCTVADFPSPVKRPAYSALENGNLQKINLDQMNHWKEALVYYLRNRY